LYSLKENIHYFLNIFLMELFFTFIIGGGVGAGILYFFFVKEGSKVQQEQEKKLSLLHTKISDTEITLKNKQLEIKELEMKAKNEAQEILSEAKNEAKEIRFELEKERARIEQREKNTEKNEKALDAKTEQLEEMKQSLQQKLEDIKTQEEELSKSKEIQRKKLEEIAKFSEEEAKEQLMKEVEDLTSEVLLKQMKKKESEIEEDSKKTAQKIIAQAIQKYAAEVATERMTTVVELPSDEMKGRIIGREGRNINAIESATGVDIIVDDTPNVVTISGFDLARRFVAKTVMEKLIEDGRIQPARIEEVAQSVRAEANEMMKQLGEEAVSELGLSQVHPDLIKVLGRLHFRTSYGQNQLKHAVEVAYICMNIANELGYDPEKAKLAGLFHDIGKAVDHEIEGGHATIGYEILKKYGVDEEIAYAIGSHHEDMPINTTLGYIVCAADAISGARPGARKESTEAYIKRLKNLENIANEFAGVKQTFALSAGREIRVIVNPENIDDYHCKKLALDIAQKIEKELSYPGQIKVHVIREIREVTYAK
jgi:ribonuclease Y